MDILKTETQAKAGVELFYQNIQSTETSYEDFLHELNLLNSYFQQHAAKKNNRVNKSATALKMYFKNEVRKKEKWKRWRSEDGRSCSVPKSLTRIIKRSTLS